MCVRDLYTATGGEICVYEPSPSRWPERHASEVDESGGATWRSGPIAVVSVLGSPRPSVAPIGRLGWRRSTRRNGIGLGRVDRSSEFVAGR